MLPTDINEKMMHNNSFDYLRILSTIGVIFIHVNFIFLSNKDPAVNHNDVNYIIESILNIITRFSVPCFVMISGALNLRNEKNQYFKQFYRKTSYKIGLPAIGAIIMLLFQNEFRIALTTRDFWPPIDSVLTGGFYNLWFLYMLAGLYLLTPFLIKLKKSISSKTYHVMGVFMMIWACISQATSYQLLSYSMGVVIAFLAYYIIGDIIYEKQTAGSNYNVVLCSIISIAMYVITFFIRYFGISEYYISSAHTCFFSPTIIGASVCIFMCFTAFHFKTSCSSLANLTYYIYLFHTITYSTLKVILQEYFPNEILAIIVIVILTFIISSILALVYQYIWRLLEIKFDIKNKWYSLVIWK